MRKGSSKGAVMPVLIGLAILVAVSTFTYFGLQWMESEKAKNVEELNMLRQLQIYQQQQITGGETVGTGIVPTAGPKPDKVIAIESVTFNTRTRYANSFTADSTGAVKAFRAGADPMDANANPVKSNTLSSGTVTDTSKVLKTDTEYRWIYDGAGTYYGEDLGEFEIDYYTMYNPDRGVASFPKDPIDITEIGTFSDMGDEQDWNQTDDALYCNGQTSNAVGTTELGTASADALTYDISVGDGVFSECVKIECTGANKACQDVVIDFQWDNTNPPEGNEITAITVQLQEGTDFDLPSDLVNYWKNQQAVSVNNGDLIKGGQSAVYKFTFTVTEGNLDANDDWTAFLDDLGGLNALDIGQDVGATSDKRSMDAQA